MNKGQNVPDYEEGVTDGLGQISLTPIQRPLNHFVFWHIYICIAYLSLYLGPSPNKPDFLDIYLHQILGISLIYAESFLILPWLYKGRHLATFVIAHAVAFVVFSLVRYGLNEVLVVIINDRGFSEANLGNIWIMGLYVWVLFTTLGFGYYHTLDSIAKRDEIIRLERLQFATMLEAAHANARREAVERDKAKAELALLQAQINPHFLFNTLNFLYSQARRLSKDLAQSIMVLSEMMQYTVNNPTDRNEVPLEGEVYYLKNYIQMQRSRFDDKLSVLFVVDDDQADLRQQIVPLVLITFVENAFKYGDLHDPQQPLSINLTITEEQLQFSCWNKIRKSGSIEPSSGIGLSNISRRLSSVYTQDRYELAIANDNQFFDVRFALRFP